MRFTSGEFAAILPCFSSALSTACLNIANSQSENDKFLHVSFSLILSNILKYYFEFVFGLVVELVFKYTAVFGNVFGLANHSSLALIKFLKNPIII